MSKEAIIKELPDEFVRTMRNWVKTGACIGNYGISPAYEGMPFNAKFGSRIPAGVGEAPFVDQALDDVPNRERLAVRLFWLYEGCDLVWLGNRLHCDYRTAEVRVRKGHQQLRQGLAIRVAAYDRRLEAARACA